LSGSLIRELNRDFNIIKMLFDAIKPCYSGFTGIPKIIYKRLDDFLDTLKKTNMARGMHNDIYIRLAMNTPLSITLVFQHFVEISYFVSEAFKGDGEVLKEAFNIFEASLDLVSTEVFSSVPKDTMISIVGKLVEYSQGGLFALAATQILSKLHGPMKIHINNPTKVIHTIYPRYDTFLDAEALIVKCDNLIYNAIKMVRGEFSKEISPRIYASTAPIQTFRANLVNKYSGESVDSAVELIIGFLFAALG